MNLTFVGQIFMEVIIISSLIITFSYLRSQKSQSPILLEKNDVSLSEEKESREVIFEIVRLREIIKIAMSQLSFFLVIVVALCIFIAFGISVSEILGINIFKLFIEFFNFVVELVKKFRRFILLFNEFNEKNKVEQNV